MGLTLGGGPLCPTRAGDLDSGTRICEHARCCTSGPRLAVAEAVVEDGAWCYPDALGEVLQVRDHLSFLGEGVDVLVEGRPAPGTRP